MASYINDTTLSDAYKAAKEKFKPGTPEYRKTFNTVFCSMMGDCKEAVFSPNSVIVNNGEIRRYAFSPRQVKIYINNMYGKDTEDAKKFLASE